MRTQELAQGPVAGEAQAPDVGDSSTRGSCTWSRGAYHTGSLIMLLGVWQMVRYSLVNGLAIVALGWLLRHVAAASIRHARLYVLLQRYVVRDVMLNDAPHILPRLTVDVAVAQVVAPHSYRRCFPVVDRGELRGLLTRARLARIPRAQWRTVRVEDVMVPCNGLQVVRLADNLADLFARMKAQNISECVVVEDGRLMGLVERDFLLAWLRIRARLMARIAHSGPCGRPDT